MQTYSHFLMTALANDRLKKREKPIQVNSRGLLLGSFMPDMPLFALTIGYMLYRRFISPSDEFIFGPSYDALYFGNPWWIIGHSVMHAPLMIALMIALGIYAKRRGLAWGNALLWFGIGCGFHSFVDILTHANDGPLLLFPFDWQTRFQSPVSYWDDDYYGNIFGPIEHLLDLGIIGYFVVNWIRRRRQQRADAITQP